MPFAKRSKPKAERVVRRKQPDGTTKEYRYPAFKPKAIVPQSDTIAALIDAYKDSPEWRALAEESRRVYSIYLQTLAPVGHTDPKKMTRRDILAMRDAIATGRGNGASSGFVRAAGALFVWAVDRQWLDHSPVTKIKHLAGGRLKAWTPQQAAAGQELLPEHLRRIVILGMYTGQRRSDLCAMRWSAYDGSRIRLTQIKTKAELVIPVHPTLKQDLDAWKSERTVGLTILTNSAGRPWKPSAMTHAMKEALRTLGMPDINVHGLRKLASANLADAGCSTKEIMSITGHQTSAMVDLYTKSADQERLANAAILRLVKREAV